MALQTEQQTKTVEAQRDEVSKVVGEVERALQEMEAEGEKAKGELKEIRQEIQNVRELVPKVRGSHRRAEIATEPSALAHRVVTSSGDLHPDRSPPRAQIP